MTVTDKSEKNWYALYVNVRHEKSINAKFLEQGIDVYLPVVRKYKQWSDRKKMVELPLIPGYIFVRTASHEMDRPRMVKGVINYVRFHGKPALIRNEEIEGLKYFVTNGYIMEEPTDEDMRVGDIVKYALSDFSSFNARIESLIGNRFAMITFDGVQMNFKVKAPVKALRKKQSEVCEPKRS